jgi:serine protease Do
MTGNGKFFSADRRKILAPRRVVLLASAAGLGIALLVGGPGGFRPMSFARADAGTSTDAAVHPAGFADLVAKVQPAVISVRVKLDQTANAEDMSGGDSQANPFAPNSPMERFFKQFGMPNMPNAPRDTMPRHQIITGVGSGFFISPDGYAVTNYHVVDHSTNVQVTTDGGTVYPAKVVGTDPKTDLALIKVEPKNGKQFAYVKFADHAPRVGDWVVAIGNPYGLGGTVTAGIVSARGRNIGNAYDDYLQIDAPINKGNSGGPAFNMNGKVVGINTAIFSPSGGSVGIGFDIPADTAKQVIAQLKDQGHVVRGWLGVQIQPVTKGIADSLGMNKPEGAMVDEAQPDSPAAKAGILAGDVITAVNGTPVKDTRDLVRSIGMTAPDHTVKLEILRKGEIRTVAVTLGKTPEQHQAKAQTESPAAPTPTKDLPHLGIEVAPATDVAGAGDKGVVVLNADPNGPAAQQGIRSGDVILDVAGKPVANAADVTHALTDAKASGRHDVLLRVKTAKATMFVAVPFGKA